jgi:hypothetical protein
MPRDMAQRDFNDQEPGVPPEVRRIAGGALAFLIGIAADETALASAQLVLRWEPDGRLFAALLRAPLRSEQG